MRLTVVMLAIVACGPRPTTTPTATALAPTPAPAPDPALPIAAPPPAEAPAPDPPHLLDPTGETPPPVTDPTLAALPLDVRVVSLTALFATHRRDCKAFAPRSRCEIVLDLDGDAAPERAFKIRARTSGHAGIAVLWADDSVSIIGADAPSRQLRTDVYMDGVELEWNEVEPDLALASWRTAAPEEDGYTVLSPGAKTVLRAPGLVGAGLWLDGGDAVEILYWDRRHWRRLIVGF